MNVKAKTTEREQLAFLPCLHPGFVAPSSE